MGNFVKIMIGIVIVLLILGVLVFLVSYGTHRGQPSYASSSALYSHCLASHV
jgi:hypothetical protein